MVVVNYFPDSGKTGEDRRAGGKGGSTSVDSSISQAAQKMCFSPTPPSLSKASAGMARRPPASSIAFTASRMTALHRSTCAGARARATAISCAGFRCTTSARGLYLPGKPPPLALIHYRSASKGIAAVEYQATSERLECLVSHKNPKSSELIYPWQPACDGSDCGPHRGHVCLPALQPLQPPAPTRPAGSCTVRRRGTARLMGGEFQGGVGAHAVPGGAPPPVRTVRLYGARLPPATHHPPPVNLSALCASG